MANVEIPDFDAKLMWRRFRAAIWTFLCAFAAACFFNVMKPPEWIAGFMAVVYLVALCVFFWPHFAKRFNV